MISELEIGSFVKKFNIKNSTDITFVSFEENEISLEFNDEDDIIVFREAFAKKFKSTVHTNRMEKKEDKLTITVTFSVEEEKSPVEEIIGMLKNYEGTHPRTFINEED